MALLGSVNKCLTTLLDGSASLTHKTAFCIIILLCDYVCCIVILLLGSIKHRLAQLTNKCSGSDDLEYYIRESGEVTHRHIALLTFNPFCACQIESVTSESTCRSHCACVKSMAYQDRLRPQICASQYEA